MKSRNILTVLLFGTVLVNTGIVCAQSTIPCDGICYTDNQDKRCLECFSDREQDEKTILDQREIIIVKDSIIDNRGFEINACNERTVKLTSDIADLEDKVVRRGKIALILGSSGGLIGGYFVGRGIK